MEPRRRQTSGDCTVSNPKPLGCQGQNNRRRARLVINRVSIVITSSTTAVPRPPGTHQRGTLPGSADAPGPTGTGHHRACGGRGRGDYAASVADEPVGSVAPQLHPVDCLKVGYRSLPDRSAPGLRLLPHRRRTSRLRRILDQVGDLRRIGLQIEQLLVVPFRIDHVLPVAPDHTL